MNTIMYSWPSDTTENMTGAAHSAEFMIKLAPYQYLHTSLQYKLES